MSEFVCDNCEQIFTQKINLQYHLDHDACKNKLFPCKTCNKQFSAKSSMYRHMRDSCVVKKQQDAEKETILEKLVKIEKQNEVMINEMEHLKSENKKLIKENKKLKVIGSTTINSKIGTINNNTNTNKGVVINNNITLVGYGKEDLTKLDKTELLKILQQGYNSTIKLTEAVHFNPKYPEYHNIFISNMKDKYAMMFDGDTWTLTTKEDLINKIYEDKKNYIEENFEDFIDSLTPSRKKALERWLESDENDAKVIEIKDNIKLLLYNRRKMITDTIAKCNKINGKDSKTTKTVKSKG